MFDVGAGLTELTVSTAMMSQLGSSGISLDLFCMVARLDGLRFDPTTGERLPTFVIRERIPDFVFEYSMVVPKCVRATQITKMKFSAWLSFRDCDIRFNPVSGAPITEADKALPMADGLGVFGEASPTPSEASLAALEKKKDAKEQERQQLRKLLGK